MMYAVFLMIFATLGGILAGTNIHALFGEKEHDGNNWTGFVIGMVTIVLAGSMVWIHPC